MDWKDKLDDKTRKHLGAQLKQTLDNKNAILNSKDKKNAQLWVAIANLSEQIVSLSLKIKFLEKALQEISGKKKDREDAKKIVESLYKL